MDIAEIAKKLGLSESKNLIRKAAELRRLCDVQFDSSIIGVGEVCKAVICLEIAATRFQVIFDRKAAMRLSGMSETAYNRSFNSLQNGLGLKSKLDVRELGIQFGCVRLIPFVRKGLSLYKKRFLAALPPTRRANADCDRPAFTAIAFYLCAKRHKLKIDKLKLIEICGSSESEFKSVSASMKDLCHDVFGVSKEKKDPRELKGNRDLLDALPEKRNHEDGGYLSDGGAEVFTNLAATLNLKTAALESNIIGFGKPIEQKVSRNNKRKRMEKVAYEEWKSSVMSSNKKSKTKGPCKRTRQTCLDFLTVP